MTIIAMPLPERLTPNKTQKSVGYRVRSMQFGDGYEQRSADGINSEVQTWELTWENLNLTEKTTIEDALRSTAGVDYITWTPFNEPSEFRFVMMPDSLVITHYSDTIFTISVNIRQVFDI